MERIMNCIKAKNIEKMYNIKEITKDGQILVNDKKIAIYKVKPANIIACDEESKFKLYQAYLSCLRGLPDTIQIVISKQKTDMKSQIEYYKERMLEIESMGLKLAIKKYIEYLENLSKTNKLYKTSHYLVIEDLTRKDMDQIIEMFQNLKEFGVTVSKVNTCKEAELVLKEAFAVGQSIT